MENFRNEKEFSKFCRLILIANNGVAHFGSGSFFELPLIYFFDNITDIDIISYSENCLAIPINERELSHFNGTIFIIDSVGSPHGYCRLLIEDGAQNLFPYTRKQFISDPLSQPAKTEKIHENDKILVCYLNMKLGGRNSLDLTNMQQDNVDAIYSPYWPEQAQEWISRQRPNGWPSVDTVKEVTNRGCFVIAKPHPNNQTVENEFRYSFSEAELLLIHSWNDVQKYIYHILRLIKDDVVRKCGGKDGTVLRTYHFKTLMLWECEEKPPSFWNCDDVESCVTELLCKMIEWLIEKECRNYFIANNNMLDNLPSHHDFTLEVQLLLQSANNVHPYIANSVSLYRCSSDERKLEIELPGLFCLMLQLLCVREKIVNPYNREGFMPTHCFENIKWIRYEIRILYKALTIHRRIMSFASGHARDLMYNDMPSNIREARKYFDMKEGKQFLFYCCACINIEISQRDGLHDIFDKIMKIVPDVENDHFIKMKPEKLLSSKVWHERRKNGSIEPNRSIRHEMTDKAFQGNVGITNSYLELVQMKLLYEILDDKIHHPCSVTKAAYEANFYYTISELGQREDSLENLRTALRICDIYLTRFRKCHSFPTRSARRVDSLFMVIDKKWSLIFDKYIQTLFGFVALFKAVMNRNANVRDLLIQIDPFKFFVYIKIQSTRLLVERMNQVWKISPEDEISLLCENRSSQLSTVVLQKALYISRGNLS